MEILDKTFINMVQIILPFTIYLFYMAYKKVGDEREDNLIIIITIFTSLYIGIKYNLTLIDGFPLIIINVPLVISYYKRNKLAIFSSSIIIITYSFYFYNSYLILFIIEYILYYIIYKLINKKQIELFVIFFSTIKTLFMLIILFLEHQNTYYIKALFLGLCFLILAETIIYFLKKAEKILEIHRLVKEIEHDKEVRTMLFKITHEIKNPIAVCKGYLDMFDINNPKHAKKYIPIMKEEISKTLYLLEDFLSMNRIKLNKDILDINLLLEEVISNFKLFWQEKKIKTKINLLDDEIYINGDYNRLRQVFVNIIKNSMEALKENPKIEIETKVKKDKIYIFFKDNGIGISKDILEKIKEPFFTTKQKGTGLGVPLSYEIIKGHNGQIKYNSKEGEYTLVTIVLPIIKL